MGHNDSVVLCGRAAAQRIKGTPGITGWKRWRITSPTTGVQFQAINPFVSMPRAFSQAHQVSYSLGTHGSFPMIKETGALSLTTHLNRIPIASVWRFDSIRPICRHGVLIRDWVGFSLLFYTVAFAQVIRCGVSDINIGMNQHWPRMPTPLTGSTNLKLLGWSRNLLLYETKVFIPVFTKYRHQILFEATWTQSIPSHPISSKSILI
jgi:hypothetical protein